MRILKEMFILAIGFLAFVYLINPTAGFIEFIPDALPIVGNIDEGFATMVLLSVLRYYGLDLGRIFGNGKAQPTIISQAPRQDNQA